MATRPGIAQMAIQPVGWQVGRSTPPRGYFYAPERPRHRQLSRGHGRAPLRCCTDANASASQPDVKQASLLSLSINHLRWRAAVSAQASNRAFVAHIAVTRWLNVKVKLKLTSYIVTSRLTCHEVSGPCSGLRALSRHGLCPVSATCHSTQLRQAQRGVRVRSGVRASRHIILQNQIQCAHNDYGIDYGVQVGEEPVRISSMVLLVAYAFYYKNVLSIIIYHHMPRERRCLRHSGAQQ
jgi:hypothetical protein